MVKNPPASVEDVGSISGLGASPGGGNSHPLQCSCLRNPMDRGAWQATLHGVARVRHDLATKPPPDKCFAFFFSSQISLKHWSSSCTEAPFPSKFTFSLRLQVLRGPSELLNNPSCPGQTIPLPSKQSSSRLVFHIFDTLPLSWLITL